MFRNLLIAFKVYIVLSRNNNAHCYSLTSPPM